MTPLFPSAFFIPLNPHERYRFKRETLDRWKWETLVVEPSAKRKKMGLLLRLITRKEYSQTRILKLFQARAALIDNASDLQPADKEQFYSNFKMLVQRAIAQNERYRKKSTLYRWIFAKMPIQVFPFEQTIQAFEKVQYKDKATSDLAHLKSLVDPLPPVFDDVTSEQSAKFETIQNILDRLEKNPALQLDEYKKEQDTMAQAFSNKKALFIAKIQEMLDEVNAEILQGLEKAGSSDANEINALQTRLIERCTPKLFLALNLPKIPDFALQNTRAKELEETLNKLSGRAKELYQNLLKKEEIQSGIKAVERAFNEISFPQLETVDDHWIALYHETQGKLIELKETLGILHAEMPDGSDSQKLLIYPLSNAIEKRGEELAKHYFENIKGFYEKENKRRQAVEGTLLACIHTKDKEAIAPLIQDIGQSIAEDAFYQSALSLKENPFLKNAEGYEAFMQTLGEQIKKQSILKIRAEHILKPEAVEKQEEMTLEEAIKEMREALNHPTLKGMKKQRYVSYPHWEALPKFITAAEKRDTLVAYVTSQMLKDSSGKETGRFIDHREVYRKLQKEVDLYFHTEDKLKDGTDQDPRPVLRDAPFAYARAYRLAKKHNLLNSFFNEVFRSFCAEGNYRTLIEWAEKFSLPEDQDLVVDLAECYTVDDVLNTLFLVFKATRFRTYFEEEEGRKFDRFNKTDLEALEAFKKNTPDGVLKEEEFKQFIQDKFSGIDQEKIKDGQMIKVQISVKQALDAYPNWNLITCSF